jgi:hypothetical protein
MKRAAVRTRLMRRWYSEGEKEIKKMLSDVE